MDTLEQAKEFFLQGIRQYQAGNLQQARAQFEASLALAPGRPSTLTNLGAVLLRLGNAEEALATLDQAIRADPANPEARGHRTIALVELGRHQEALACVDEVLSKDRGIPALWTMRGNLLRDLGRPDEAVAAFRAALENGGDPAVNNYYIAAITGSAPPPASPAAYVRALFDGYARGFDEHLVKVLRYRAPEILVDRLSKQSFDCVIDLGCGTGLCGERVRSRARRVVGVDLSANMVQQARARGAYDEVVQGDVVEFLRGLPEGSADLVLAADVFIYVGALEEVFERVHAAMKPQGIFAFSVELAPGPQRVVLLPSMRYAQSREYILELAQRYGFEPTALEEHPIRHDQMQPIPGLFVWLHRAP
jgi:predicted TPR repeat methyltransferase